MNLKSKLSVLNECLEWGDKYHFSVVKSDPHTPSRGFEWWYYYLSDDNKVHSKGIFTYCNFRKFSS